MASGAKNVTSWSHYYTISHHRISWMVPSYNHVCNSSYAFPRITRQGITLNSILFKTHFLSWFQSTLDFLAAPMLSSVENIFPKYMQAFSFKLGLILSQIASSQFN